MRKRDVLKEMINGFRCMLGPFGRLFRIYPHYLPFLHLDHDQDIESPISLELSLRKINKIFQSKSLNQINNGVKTLLNSMNWRTHLVGCIAIIKMSKENQKDYYKRLWDLGSNDDSWVSPQILAILSIIDPDFSIKIRNNKIEGKFLNNEILLQEIEFLLNPEKMTDDNHKEIHGLPWNNRLIELIREGKL